MKFKEIQGKGAEELGSLEEKLRKELAEIWLQIRSGPSTQTAKVRTLKRDIARVLTARRMKEGE